MANLTSHHFLVPAANNRCPVCQRPVVTPEPSEEVETTPPEPDVERERLKVLLGEARLLADSFYLFQGNPDPDNVARLFESAESVAFYTRALLSESETGSFGY